MSNKRLVIETKMITHYFKFTGPQGTYQTKMRKVALTVISKPACEAMLKRTRLGAYFILNESFVCAGGMRNLDACQGDGGGPLVCLKPGGDWVQAGIVSWGIECGMQDVPGVYVDVSVVSNWISTNMMRLNADTVPRFAPMK